tara:strand:+ start:328 stop:543 length:216 start_codon:yes stop_codon:yes gene_type:complete
MKLKTLMLDLHPSPGQGRAGQGRAAGQQGSRAGQVGPGTSPLPKLRNATGQHQISTFLKSFNLPAISHRYK